MANNIGQNIQAEVKGSTLTLTIDLSKRLGRSKSGKTIMVATTNGNQALPGGVTIGINAYTKE